MSHPEELNTVMRNIVDQEGVPIIETAERQFEAQRTLSRERRVASVHAKTFQKAKDDKRKELKLEGEMDSSECGWKREFELLDELDIIIDGLGIANETASRAEQQLEQNDRASAAHVAENLPQYIEAASYLANLDLQRRIGTLTAIRTQGGLVVDFRTVTLVDPAMRNEDVAHL